mgnify:CR=1 FL=1
MNLIFNLPDDTELLKIVLDYFNKEHEPPVKRGRGRPRKHPIKDPNAPKRRVGRPSLNGL